MAVNTSSNLSLRFVLEKDKLVGTNFLDWFKNLRIVLKHEMKLYVLDEPIPEELPTNAPRAQKDAYKKHSDDSLDVGCLMLATMSPDLQKGLENMEAYEIILPLKEMFQQQARQEQLRLPKPCIHASWLKRDQ